jgi:hypothetical protein
MGRPGMCRALACYKVCVGSSRLVRPLGGGAAGRDNREKYREFLRLKLAPRTIAPRPYLNRRSLHQAANNGHVRSPSPCTTCITTFAAFIGHKELSGGTSARKRTRSIRGDFRERCWRNYLWLDVLSCLLPVSQSNMHKRSLCIPYPLDRHQSSILRLQIPYLKRGRPLSHRLRQVPFRGLGRYFNSHQLAHPAVY